MSESIYLYFIRCGEYTKVGVARNPQERLADLQTGSPEVMTIVGLFEFDGHATVHTAEKLFHHAHADLRVRGEWFALRQDYIDMLHNVKSCFVVDHFPEWIPRIKNKAVIKRAEYTLEHFRRLDAGEEVDCA